MLVSDLRAHPVEVDDLDADGFLVLAADIETKERSAARDKLRLAAQWCVRHPATVDTGGARWANNSRMTIQPVLDLGRGDSVDRHDPPAWMRELVILRDRHGAFPWCTRDARACDLDHIQPYDPGTKDDPGPPGQTSPANLAPLCRRHHRCKTVGRWKYQRKPDGTYRWRSPHGRNYLVSPTDTRTLDARTDPQA